MPNNSAWWPFLGMVSLGAPNWKAVNKGVQNLQNHFTELQVLQKILSKKRTFWKLKKWCGVSKRKNNFQKVMFHHLTLQETNISQEGILFLEGDIKFMTFSTPPDDINLNFSPKKRISLASQKVGTRLGFSS